MPLPHCDTAALPPPRQQGAVKRLIWADDPRRRSSRRVEKHLDMADSLSCRPASGRLDSSGESSLPLQLTSVFTVG
ncbi:hypothetical protein F2P81_013189 [Scophthalmus maximus]|uniref:Uncharacterized protein n=1 Tax=Scophthalmus maximus TaxID=52904 RepID=A0A6A4SWQ4_SCOMX|nr:hypothetical protein F2P81_013189 [Scophthalmus maximus]